MGFTRKVMSVSSLGLVDFRSDKERTAAYTAATKKQAKKQTKLLKEQNKTLKQAAEQQASAAAPTPPPQAVPAGWYPDPSAGIQRYWDGTRWTEHTAPLG